MKTPKVLSIVCAAMMVISFFPTTVKAEVPEEVIIDGVVYEHYHDSEWCVTGYTDDLPENVVIRSEINGNPVTYIYGFYDCSVMRSIELPDSLTDIDSQAFLGCSNLSSVEIPEGVVTVGSGAFSFCDNLTSISIPSTLNMEYQHYYAEYEYSTPFINASEFAFIPNLTEFIVAEDNPWLTSIDGVLYTKDKTTLITYPSGKNAGGEYAIPEGTINAGNGFHSAQLRKIHIPKSLTAIDDGSLVREYFVDTPLASKSVMEYEVDPDNQTYCSVDGVLYSKDMTTLLSCPPAKETETGTFIVPENIEKIADRAFWGCENLSSITILNPDCEIESMWGELFSNQYIADNYGGYWEWGGIIRGYDHSTAQAFAEKYGYTFESLDKAPEIVSPKRGNFNGDTVIDATDAADLLVVLAKLGAGADVPLTDEQTSAADADGDGELNAADASVILQYAAYVGAGGELELSEWYTA